jgi:hypothetical protein
MTCTAIKDDGFNGLEYWRYTSTSLYKMIKNVHVGTYQLNVEELNIITLTAKVANTWHTCYKIHEENIHLFFFIPSEWTVSWLSSTSTLPNSATSVRYVPFLLILLVLCYPTFTQYPVIKSWTQQTIKFTIHGFGFYCAINCLRVQSLSGWLKPGWSYHSCEYEVYSVLECHALRAYMLFQSM